MEYLHESPVGPHGHLTSSNCVVDRKWECRITDYGLKQFKRTKNQEIPTFRWNSGRSTKVYSSCGRAFRPIHFIENNFVADQLWPVIGKILFSSLHDVIMLYSNAKYIQDTYMHIVLVNRGEMVTVRRNL